ncbi:MAG: aminoglycoside phosphotransferase family protein [Desulfobulbaceae bacterium]|nr:aminoglycoside phosphotransferase family protein [Desulfobulbaceae bacterium]
MVPGNSLSLEGICLQGAVEHFFFDAAPRNITPYGDGNINDSWLVTQSNGNDWILQRINSHVFSRPDLVLSNMRLVINHLVKEGRRLGLVPERLQVFYLKTGSNSADYFIDEDNYWWRAISFINDTTTFRTIHHPVQAMEIGSGLGLFHRLLSTLPSVSLADTLPGFHDTSNYLVNYDVIFKKYSASLNEEEIYCARFVEKRRHLPDLLTREKQNLIIQATHNDPKVANFLFSSDGKRVVSLVDLDTVKPGLLLHDIGDGLRSCCSLGREDFAEKGPLFDPEFFRSFLIGYQQEFGLRLTHWDQNRIVAATLLITFELGLRFFSDHLSGNVYFKIDYPGHNLKRGLALFHQAAKMESMRDQLDDIVSDIFSTDSITTNPLI